MPVLDEFSLIQRFFTPTVSPASVLLGVGDDCALLTVPPGEVLAVSIDTQVSGVHFPVDAEAGAVASRVLRCAVSDLAAMGAAPLGFTIALTLPAVDEAWLSNFSEGLLNTAQTLQCPLVGGDTTRGPLCISVQVHGSVPPTHALRRDGAQVGDVVWVSGSLGDGAAALAVLEGRLSVPMDAAAWLKNRFYQPGIDIDLGVALRGVATACIDVSDGLLADFGHIARASGVAAEIDVATVPISPVWATIAGTTQARQWALTGGDDYRLCFTAPASAQAALCAAHHSVMPIGRIVAGQGVFVRDENGMRPVAGPAGFQHFSAR